MKIIVVSGARSNVGKTHLARALCKLLPGAVRVKIGHHQPTPGGDENLYPVGTGFSTIVADHPDAPFLIIESNRILKEITPDCAIYLPADNEKPSAEIAVEKADIVRGVPVPASKISLLAKNMGCDDAVIRTIIELSGETPPPGAIALRTATHSTKGGKSAKHPDGGPFRKTTDSEERSATVSVEEARRIILHSIAPLGAESVSLMEASDRFLAEDIVSDAMLPPMDDSAMDGYAVRAEDTRGASRDNPARLLITAEVRAGGTLAGKKVSRGTAIRIMTGRRYRKAPTR